MKKGLPHLVYIGLLLAAGSYLQWSENRENRLVEFLSRPTDEAYFVIEQMNRQLKATINQIDDVYPNFYSQELNRRSKIADSLVTHALAGEGERDSLPAHLWALTDRDPRLKASFQAFFSGKKTFDVLTGHRRCFAQNDSLRLQIAQLKTLQELAGRISSEEDIRYDQFSPAVSCSTLCPAVGEPFEMDIVLSNLSRWRHFDKININGQQLAMEDGVAHFEQTFPAPGKYPLQVWAEGRRWESDTLYSVEKTFFIRVNR